jgi:hypothetical protein
MLDAVPQVFYFHLYVYLLFFFSYFSGLVEQLYYYDFHNVYGIDYSEAAINGQNSREAETGVPKDHCFFFFCFFFFEYELVKVADILDKTPFEDGYFDVIFDKG